MPAYILTVVELKNVTEDFKRYSAQAAALSKQFGGEYLIRGKAAQVYEGGLFAGNVFAQAEALASAVAARNAMGPASFMVGSLWPAVPARKAISPSRTTNAACDSGSSTESAICSYLPL